MANKYRIVTPTVYDMRTKPWKLTGMVYPGDQYDKVHIYLDVPATDVTDALDPIMIWVPQPIAQEIVDAHNNSLRNNDK